jgi:hypothetical protein
LVAVGCHEMNYYALFKNGFNQIGECFRCIRICQTIRLDTRTDVELWYHTADVAPPAVLLLVRIGGSARASCGSVLQGVRHW